MGAQCSSGSRSKPAYRIHFLGVDKEGQSTVLNHLRLTPRLVAKGLPMLACIVEEISTDFRDEENWYFGGRSSMRAFYHYFHETTDGIVYVIDSKDTDELDNALDKLDHHILKDALTENKVMMLLANRQGAEGALCLEEIENKVKEKITTHEPTLGGRVLFLKGCDSETKVGIKEAFSWFLEIVQQHKESQLTSGYHSLAESVVTEKKQDNNPFHSLKKMFDVSYMKSILLH